MIFFSAKEILMNLIACAEILQRLPSFSFSHIQSDINAVSGNSWVPYAPDTPILAHTHIIFLSVHLKSILNGFPSSALTLCCPFSRKWQPNKFLKIT